MAEIYQTRQKNSSIGQGEARDAIDGQTKKMPG